MIVEYYEKMGTIENDENNKHVSYAVDCTISSNKQRNNGYLIITESGQLGQTNHKDKMINGKYQVYLEDGSKILCPPEKLKIRGFTD